MSVYAKLKELNITLAPPAAPAAAYVMYVQTGNLVFISGHIAKNADGSVNAGQLGKDITAGTRPGSRARSIAIDLVGTLQEACGGDLTRVKRIVKLMSLVNSTPDFTDQHLVTNGASELLGEAVRRRRQARALGLRRGADAARRLRRDRNDRRNRRLSNDPGGAYPAPPFPRPPTQRAL